MSAWQRHSKEKEGDAPGWFRHAKPLTFHASSDAVDSCMAFRAGAWQSPLGIGRRVLPAFWVKRIGGQTWIQGVAAALIVHRRLQTDKRSYLPGDKRMEAAILNAASPSTPGLNKKP
jgi:hypothetical protein